MQRLHFITLDRSLCFSKPLNSTAFFSSPLFLPVFVRLSSRLFLFFINIKSPETALPRTSKHTCVSGACFCWTEEQIFFREAEQHFHEQNNIYLNSAVPQCLALLPRCMKVVGLIPGLGSF